MKMNSPYRRKQGFEVLSNSKKVLGFVLEPHFAGFEVSYRGKHAFKGCVKVI